MRSAFAVSLEAPESVSRLRAFKRCAISRCVSLPRRREGCMISMIYQVPEAPASQKKTGVGKKDIWSQNETSGGTIGRNKRICKGGKRGDYPLKSSKPRGWFVARGAGGEG